MNYLMVIILAFQICCQTSAQQSTFGTSPAKAERRPFQRSNVLLKSPTTYLKRETSEGKYDPKPRVILIDEVSGKYELRWVGVDRRDKIVVYQRPDALHAVVEARVNGNEQGKFSFTYLIRNHPDSPAFLSGFVVQTLSGDIRDETIPVKNDVHTGHMGSYIPAFKVGVWRRFAPLGEKLPRIDPDMSIEFALVSSGLPGIVECRATGGNLMLKGAGEHMPTELENVIPGYEAWAKGYTVGPVDSLREMSLSEKSKYLLDNLPKFAEAGWMAGSTPETYKMILVKNDLVAVFEQAKKDFDNGFITSEVFAIVQGLAASS